MTPQDAIQLLMRYIHILSAVTATGGMAFILICLTPAMRLVDEKFRDSVLQIVHHRFLRVVWLSILGLVVSGTYNWIQLAGTYKAMGPIGNAMIGVKVLLAIVMFTVVGFRSIGWIKKPRTALMVNVHLAAAVILLGAVLRHLRLEHLQSLISR